MTETEMEPFRPTAATATNAWDAAFATLKTHYPRAKDSIVFCVHALRANPEIALDDLKAQALMHGIRITGASVTAAQKLMAGTTTPTAPTAPTAPAAARTQTEVATRPARRVRATETNVDPAALIQQVVAKLQQQSGADAERLRDAIRKAIAVLQAAMS